MGLALRTEEMLLTLFKTFLKIGLFTFGGGYAMIANIREEIVEKRGWLTEEELLEIITVAESTPGPIAINLATYVGYRKRGCFGSLCATVGVVLPSLLIVYLISLFLEAFMQNRIVAYAFVGIRCAVVILILNAGMALFRKIPKKPLPLIVFVLVFLLMILGEAGVIPVSTIVLILAGGGVGILADAVARHRKGADDR